MKERISIKIEGIVQGVGFRPFLHRLAREQHINGWVQNTSAGLEGVLEGETADLEHFLAELKDSPPPLAQIESVRTEQLQRPSDTFEQFTIRESRMKAGATLISPDIAMCPECEAELRTPSDRRYRYPFINCTNCGPRYTIIESLPYDRERTVMKEFPMCHDCGNEYNDINNRRYHAQPDCCPECGPEVFYIEAASCPQHDKSGLTGRFPGICGIESSPALTGNDACRRSQELLSRGGILAVKGIGGIHLACDALNPDAVRRLRERKHRAEKPLAVMCRSVAAARRICKITPSEEKLLTAPARPIVLLEKKKDISDLQEALSLETLSFSPRLGVMLPYTPLHALLLDKTYGGPDILVMTSGNIPGCPVLTENISALEALADVADGFLLHDRRIANRCDDSLVSEWRGQPYFLRRSRGYAPRPLTFNASDGIFALGAEQKASFALGRDSHVFLSPYIGDLKNAETFAHYTETLDTYEKLFKLKPSVYVCDLHPDYLSTHEAKQRSGADNVPLLQVQHHWAHLASCMADNDLDTPCFGIIWDGTGLGTDGNIWGGEFLTGDFGSFTRTGSIRPVPLPGGDRAIREISRIALALAEDAGINDFACVPLPKEKRDMLLALLSTSHPPVPSASSIGRLFDGVCSLILGRSEIDYEGEGAALVEALAPVETPEQAEASLQELSYPVTFYEQDGIRFFDTRPMLRSLIDDLRMQNALENKGFIALRFMATLICMAADQCRALNPARLPVVLSGGVFQNRFLLHGITSMLEENGFTVYTHHRVPANDEGLSLGQLAIACRKRQLQETEYTEKGA